LALAGVFQQRFAVAPGSLSGQLRRRAGIVMRQRQIGGFARLRSLNDMPTSCAVHRIQAGGFGVETDQLGGWSLSSQRVSAASSRIVS
jgi:hypothetical protein